MRFASVGSEALKKIEPGLREAIQTSGQGAYIVLLRGKADLGPAYGITDWVQRGEFVYNTLRSFAAQSQAGLIASLEADPGVVSFQPYFIRNAVYVVSGVTTLDAVAARPEVEEIVAEQFATIPEPVIGGPEATEWGIDMIRAPELWAQGVRGAGVVVGNIDTGVQYDHPAVVNQYRGTHTASNDFNFYDPTGVCAGGVCDNNGHGTHTMGTMVGDDGAANQIGVATQARWIAAKGCASNSCSDSHLTLSAQWILAPCAFGQAPGHASCDPAQRPHIVNNSWGGGGGNAWYQSYVDAWRAAGIIPVFSAGNSGPGAGTLGSPGDYCNVIGVGGTNSADGYYTSTSWGPGAFPACTNKPDMSAPGQSVRSAIPTNSYATFSGTSMAAPHVSGCIAMMLSVDPSLTYSEIFDILTQTAVDRGDPGFDYIFGHGRIDCFEAVQQLSPDFRLEADPVSVSVCIPDSAVYDIEVFSISGFDDPVTLSAGNVPAGYSAGFSVNPVTPPGTSVMTLSNIGAATAGAYTIEVVGTAPTSTHSIDVDLILFDATPGTPALTSPSNGATNVAAQPTFTWAAASQASTYSIQVATDAGFTNVVASASGLAGTSWTPGAPLATNTTFHWRVWAENPCATGAYSATWMFTTLAAPGDCGIGTMPNEIYSYGFESGASGWTTPAGVGTNTWAIVGTNPFAGANHYRGAGTASVTDQRLVSPSIALPVGQDPVILRFWHVPNLENSGATACFDGGILEVSDNGGATWTQVPDANLLVGGYTGLVSASFGNPLAGLQAWCSASTTTYRQTIADVSAYAGQTVQFRWRIGTDTSVSRPGWDVDDVLVQSCQPAGAAITLTKTVGTDPTVCAVTDEISVSPGTEVTYCFNVTNVGVDTLTLHDLTDSHLGQLLDGFAYALAPSASAFLTQSAVIDVTTVNTATWTAYTQVPGDGATAGSSATVTVVLVPDIDVDPLALNAVQTTDTVTQQVLTIANTGSADLTWTILEEPTVSAPPAVAPDANADPTKARDEFNPGEAPGPLGEPPVLTTWGWPDAVLYDNGPLVTHPGGGFGGADASVLQTALGLNTFGFGHALTSGFRVADDFTVPLGGWWVDTFTFFAYQTGSSTTSTIDHINLRIWDGPPGDPGSSIVFGDTTTNRLVSSTWTNMYRVTDTAMSDSTRPVMASVASVGVFLPEGTYWVDWQTGGTLASGPWAPPVSLLGQTAKPGANALQYSPTTALWAQVVDTGTAQAAQDLPFIIDGTAGLLDCLTPADVPWLSVSPDGGTTSPAGSTPVTVTFDSTGLAVGIYTANLCVFSNDPDAGPGNGTELVVVPVSLTVEEPIVVTVTVVVGTPGGGTVSGGGPYNVGDMATVEAFPTAGWVFLHWLVEGSEITDNPYTFEVEGDVTLTAIFQRQVAEPIPTTGTVGLILLLGLLLGVGVFVLRRMA